MDDERSKLTDVSRRRLLQTGIAAAGGGLLSSGNVVASTRTTATASADLQIETQGNIACGETIDGTLEDGESGVFPGEGYAADYYRLDEVDGEFLNVAARTAVNFDDEIPGEPLVYLLDDTGTIMAEGTAEYEFIDGTDYVYSQISAFSPPTDGPFTVVVTSYSPETTFEYQLSVDCPSLDPEATVECGETVSGALTDDDPTGFTGRNRHYDVYAVSAPAGQVLTASITTPTPSPDEPQDPEEPVFPAPDDPSVGDSYLYLVDSDGNIAAQNDDAVGLDSVIRYTVPEAGEYRLVVSSFAPGDRFEYDLSVECRTPPEPTRIACGETVTGAFTPDDLPSTFEPSAVQDAYRFEGTAGTEVTVGLDGGTPYGYADPTLYLLDENGSVLARSEYSPNGQDALLSRVLPETGEYTVLAVGYTYEGQFDYELTLGCDPDATACPVECEESISYGTTLTDELSATDAQGFRSIGTLQDVYCFDGECNDVVTVSMASGEFGFDSPYLYLVSPDGNIVAESQDDGGYANGVIREYELKSAGTYRIVATSMTPGVQFPYTLTLQKRDE